MISSHHDGYHHPPVSTLPPPATSFAMGSHLTANSATSVMTVAAPVASVPSSNAYSDAEREQILRAYDERSSLCGLTRTFGVARNTVTSWIKKAIRVAALERNACGT